VNKTHEQIQQLSSDTVGKISVGIGGGGTTLRLSKPRIRSRKDKKGNDSPLSDADKVVWATYRQELRDLPATTSNPADPTWPEAPE